MKASCKDVVSKSGYSLMPGHLFEVSGVLTEDGVEYLRFADLPVKIWWPAHLFVMHGPSKAEPAAPKAKVATAPDLSDWRVWARVEEGQCACGIARVQCGYHR